MSRSLTQGARTALALAAAAGLRESDVAHALGVDPATLSRKKTDPRRWTGHDDQLVLDAFGDGIGALIDDLHRLRATRQYQQAPDPDTFSARHERCTPEQARELLTRERGADYAAGLSDTDAVALALAVALA